ncbi:MAG TPA: ADP-ribosylglycohydrolase family protein [Rugosimonospora sp.]|nr:ADP-ribosylglycohydrolase family protein [Rugosimonospora sp.]
MNRVAGSLFGLAYGDALGAPTEFLSVAEIERPGHGTPPARLGNRKVVPPG